MTFASGGSTVPESMPVESSPLETPSDFATRAAEADASATTEPSPRGREPKKHAKSLPTHAMTSVPTNLDDEGADIARDSGELSAHV